MQDFRARGRLLGLFHLLALQLKDHTLRLSAALLAQERAEYMDSFCLDVHQREAFGAGLIEDVLSAAPATGTVLSELRALIEVQPRN